MQPTKKLKTIVIKIPKDLSKAVLIVMKSKMFKVTGKLLL